MSKIIPKFRTHFIISIQRQLCEMNDILQCIMNELDKIEICFGKLFEPIQMR